jgi:molybdopterin molybdotransferase
MVSFELFARPGLRRMMGRLDAERPRIRAVLDEPIKRSPDGKTHFSRVFLSDDEAGGKRARLSGGQGSHQLTAMATANGLAVVPNGDGFEAGATVDVISFE